MKPISKLRSIPAYVRCKDIAALRAELDTLNHGSHLVVSLGSGLCSAEERYALAEAFAEFSDRYPLVLKTARGSIAQNVAELAELVQVFPGIKIDLDFGECYFGSEMVLGSWRNFFHIVKTLSGNITCVTPPTGSAERLSPEEGILPFFFRLLMRLRYHRVYFLVKAADLSS